MRVIPPPVSAFNSKYRNKESSLECYDACAWNETERNEELIYCIHLLPTHVCNQSHTPVTLCGACNVCLAGRFDGPTLQSWFRCPAPWGVRLVRDVTENAVAAGVSDRGGTLVPCNESNFADLRRNCRVSRTLIGRQFVCHGCSHSL